RYRAHPIDLGDFLELDHGVRRAGRGGLIHHPPPILTAPPPPPPPKPPRPPAPVGALSWGRTTLSPSFRPEAISEALSAVAPSWTCSLVWVLLYLPSRLTNAKLPRWVMAVFGSMRTLLAC